MIPLTSFERRWVRAILDTIFPRANRGALPLGAVDLDIDGFFDGLFAQAPFESSLGLRAAIWFLALAPLFVIGRFATFAGLTVEDRERVYLKLAASRIYVVRSLVIALKAIGSLLYCGDPTVRGRILAPVPEKAALLTLRAKPVIVETKAQKQEEGGAAHESRSFA
jgi:hypothetical protein